ncbi:MAG: ABC transporter permease [Acidobacteria bacterium]|nr:ABC transporter permease [Acidobacteriota bacterium]
MLAPFVALVRKDLLLFFSDRRAVLMSFAVPIAIASFFGSIFAGPSSGGEPARIAVAIADEDGSAVSRAIVARAQADRNLRVTLAASPQLRERVRRGDDAVGVILPKGFGDAAGSALFSIGGKPPLDLLFDPSKRSELALVRGVLTEHVMAAVSQAVFGGASGRQLVDRSIADLDRSDMPVDEKQRLSELLRSVQRFYDRTPAAPAGLPAAGGAPGLTLPYAVREQAVTSGTNVQYNGYAHSFAGMGIQFLLFAAANLGVEVLIERQRGLWKRLRSAPLGRSTILGAKVASIAIVSLLTLLVSFGFAMVVFRVRIAGSVAGFALVAVTCALMAATFGLLVAALGRTPGSARGVTTLAVLMMVMLGGAWVPTFVFPAWLQTATVVVPARWAVDGLDAMTWRGLGFGSALVPSAMLLGFAALFGAIAFLRFPWQDA